MSFENQLLSDFIAAKDMTSEMLMSAGLRQRSNLGFEEALIMQAASGILLEKGSFYGYEIMEAVNGGSNRVYPVLHRFKDRYGITTIQQDAEQPVDNTRARQRLPYEATEFGLTIFGLYVPE